MATLTSNPWIFLNADEGTTVHAAGPLRIKGIRWVGGTTAGHQVIIHDKNAKVKWRAIAAAANHEEADIIEDKTPWDGLVINTLDSGTLYVQYG